MIFSFLYSFLLCVLTALNFFTCFWKRNSRPPPFVSKHIFPASYMEPMLCFQRMLWKKYCWSGKLFQRLLMARYPFGVSMESLKRVYVLDTLLSKFVYKLVGPQLFFCFSNLKVCTSCFWCLNHFLVNRTSANSVRTSCSSCAKLQAFISISWSFAFKFSYPSFILSLLFIDPSFFGLFCFLQSSNPPASPEVAAAQDDWATFPRPRCPASRNWALHSSHSRQALARSVVFNSLWLLSVILHKLKT